MSPPGTYMWTAIAVAVAAIFATAAVLVVATVVPSARGARDGLTEFEGSLAGKLLAEDTSRLDGLVRTTSRVHEEIEPAAASVRWIERFSPAVSWVPVLRQETSAWGREMRRINDDIVAASALVESSIGLLDLYEDSTSHESQQPSGSNMRERLTGIRDAFQQSRESASSNGVFSLLDQLPTVRDWTGLVGDLESKILAASNLGYEVSALLVRVLDVVEEPGADAGLLGADYRLVELLDAFADNDDEIQASISSVRRARADLEVAVGDDSSGLSVSLEGLTRLVEELEAGLSLVGAISPLAGEMLGRDGLRRYLVLGQSADELRATGGFVSGVWVVTVEDGDLKHVDYQDAVAVDDWERIELYPAAPPGLEEHMNAWVWLMRDVSWDPDFPTTARTAQDMYKIGRRQDVDGVIALNQWTLLRLIDALGSITSPGANEPITSRNLLAVLEDGTDRHGRAYMDLVLQGLLDAFEKPLSLLDLTRLASNLFETLERRDTIVYFDDSSLQEVIKSFDWDGGIRQSDADYLYVVDSNVGWSKVDRNVQRDITYIVDLREAGRPRSTLTLKYDNHSGPGSPPCDPQWLNRGTNYSQLKNACYWNFLGVYMPPDTRVLSSTELPLPEHSVSVEIGRGTPGRDTGATYSSHGKTVFSGLEAIEAGKRGEVHLVYDLPPSVLSRSGGELGYRLLIQKQPGVRQRSVSVEFKLPDGYQLKAGSMVPARTAAASVRFDVSLERDTWLDVLFEEASDG